MIIYKITNLKNDKIYVGQDINNNPNYYGSGLLIKLAIKKYGKKSFIKEIIETCQSQKELDEKEIFWINKLESRNRKIGYNIDSGGRGGNLEILKGTTLFDFWVVKYGLEEATKKTLLKNKKISDYNKENKTIFDIGVYEYWIEKYGIEEANIRKENKRLKLVESNKKRKESGWEHTSETIEKIRESSTNRKHSSETKEKLRTIHLGKPKKGKPILQFSLDGLFIKEWEKIKEAQQSLNIKNIGRVLRGERKSTGGFIWKFKNNNNEKRE